MNFNYGIRVTYKRDFKYLNEFGIYKKYDRIFLFTSDINRAMTSSKELMDAVLETYFNGTSKIMDSKKIIKIEVYDIGKKIREIKLKKISSDVRH